MKEHDLEMTLLFDHYGELLTQKQKTCFDLYYNQDLSLSEIAQESGISRQGVHDFLARAEQALMEFEETLGCLAGARKLRLQLSKLEAAAQALPDSPQAQIIRSIIGEMKE